MKYLYAIMGSALFALSAAADLVLVENGQPRASIVIAEDPPRLVDLAARELQGYIQKISGAELPIGTAPDPGLPTTIYIGRSAFTDARGITNDGLHHGAYRMVSGDNWLVLLGRDRDFEPVEPWSRTREDYPATQAAWEELYGGTSAHPLNWYGGTVTSFNRAAGIWRQDEGGSLQAVYGLLRELGVRWYWPGELGEIVPHAASIVLPELDLTVQPDFAIRYFIWYSVFHAATRDDIMWSLRLGLNDGYSVIGASMPVHGMRMIHGNEYMQKNHPEFYALYGGVRDTEYRGTGHACFSSPGLQRETVKYLRAVFDHFDEPAVDLWPQDGLHHCGCELCAGKSDSEAVWGFIDRVARELYETHPDRLITAGAYSSYVQPPDTIDQFPPNVAVYISNRGRPGFVDDGNWQRYWDLISTWQDKLAPGRLIRGENNRYNTALVIHPQAFARDLRALKGISLGDIAEIHRTIQPQPTRWPNPAVNHLNYYVHANLLWDADQDLDALLDEYCRLFYGPAAAQMRAAFDYAEAHYNRRGARMLPLEHKAEFVAQLQSARALVGDDVYGARIQKWLDELPSLTELQDALQARLDAGDPRQDAPTVVGQILPTPGEQPTYRLRGIVDGAEPDVETTFRVGWEDGMLVFDITCHEPEMGELFVTPDVWGGDSVSLLLETSYHSYYQIEVNPDGVVFDSDRGFGERADGWNSMAEVETERGADYWRVILRLPIASEDEGAGDPLHQVVGDRPSTAVPWFFNLGRTRVRGVGGVDRTAYVFAPVGQATYHRPGRFARLVIE